MADHGGASHASSTSQTPQRLVSPTTIAFSLLGEETLDLTRITDRVFAGGMIWKQRTAITSHRNNIDDLSGFLNTHFSRQYMIWNLAGHGAGTSLLYDYTPFHHQVLTFDMRPNTISLKMLFDIARSLATWIKLSPKNVAYVHCTNGKLRTGIALACYMRYVGLTASASLAFDYFLQRRSANDRSWVTVTLERYLHYFDKTIDLQGTMPNPYPLRLHQIIVNTVPNFDGEGACDPILEIIQNGKLIYSSIFTHAATSLTSHPGSPKDKFQPPPAVFQDAYNIIFSMAMTPVILGRDVYIRISHRSDPTQSQSVSMLSFGFHTGFMEAGLVRISLSDMEIPAKDAHPIGVKNPLSRFHADFSMDLVLAECIDEGHTKNPLYEMIHYKPFIDPSIAKGLAKVTQYHFVRPEQDLLQVLEGQGYKKVVARFALQYSDNAIHDAHEYITARFPHDLYDNISQELVSISRAALVAMRRSKLQKAAIEDSAAVQSPQRYNDTLSALQEMQREDEEDSQMEQAMLLAPDWEATADPLSSPSATSSPSITSPKAVSRAGHDRRPSVDCLLPPPSQTSFSPDLSPVVHEEQAPPSLAAALTNERLLSTASPLPSSPDRSVTPAVASPPPVAPPAAVSISSPIPPPPIPSAPVAPLAPGVPPPPPMPMMSGVPPPPPLPGVPPPPPMLMMNGVPPPPPMPGMPGGPPPPPMPGVPGAPPPPPGMFMAGPPKKKKQVRQTLFWEELPSDRATSNDTIWGQLAADEQAEEEGVNLDVTKFEDIFVVVPGQKIEKPKSTQPASKVMTILDPKRSHNLSISLSPLTKRYDGSFDNVLQALFTWKMGIDELAVMVLLIPTAEEIEMMQVWAKQHANFDQSQLGIAEKWVLACAKQGSGNLTWAIESGTFLKQYADDCAQLQDAYTQIAELSRLLKSSEKIKVLLKTVLTLGNLTNYEYGKAAAWSMSAQPKKGAAGFKLESLPKLAEVKGKDGKTSLMHFLIDVISEQAPNLLDLSEEFIGPLMAARNLATPELFSTLSGLYATINRLGNYKIHPVTPEATAYSQRLEGALATAKQVVNDVLATSQQAWREWVHCGSYFGEDVTPLPVDPSLSASTAEEDEPKEGEPKNKKAGQDKAMWAATAKPEQMFTTWSTFFHLYADAIKQYRLRIEKEARDKAREEKAEERKKLGLKHSASAQSLKEGGDPPASEVDHFMRHLTSIRKAALSGGDGDDDSTTTSSVSEPKIKRFSTMVPSRTIAHPSNSEEGASPASQPSSFASPPQSFTSAMTTFSHALLDAVSERDSPVSE